MKNCTAFFLATLMIPATALYAQGRGGRPGGQPGGRPGGGTVSRQPGDQPSGRPGGMVPGERRLGGAVVIPGGRPDLRPVIPTDPLPPPPPSPGGPGPVIVSPDFFDPLLPGYGSYGYRRGRVIVVPRSTVIVTEPEVVQNEVIVTQPTKCYVLTCLFAVLFS